MGDATLREIALNGVWRDNPSLVQLLGLCPLLAVSDSVVKALGLGLATLVALMLSNAAVSLMRRRIADSIRLPVFMITIGATASCIEMLMQAYAFTLSAALGIFLPLIASNCILLGRAESFASRHSLLPSLLDGLTMGLGSLAALLVLGALRELVGTGALFANMSWLLGEAASDWRLQVFPSESSFLLAILPPGAFLFTGLLIAAKNLIGRRLPKRPAPDTAPPGARRVRITGDIR